MTLLEIQADLKETNAALVRIAEALERIAGPVAVDEEPTPIRKADHLGKVDLRGEKRAALKLTLVAQEELQERER
jgi:hypothetical protein